MLNQLTEFEKALAKKRRMLANSTPSQPLRLQIARDPFKSKEDALERLLVYHNTLNESEVAPELPQMWPISDRVIKAETTLRDTSFFRDSLLNQGLRSLRLDLHPTLRL